MINRSKLVFSIVCIFAVNLLTAQLNIPHVRQYTQAIYGIFLNDSSSHIRNSHLSFKPIHDSKTNSETIYKDEGNYYYWITQKLFKEHFLIFSGDDYWCAVDPILDLEIGQDFSASGQTNRFWNTRGVRIQAKFFENFGFETSFYETQARLLTYQTNYVNGHGEFILSNNAYKQVNAIIPSYARTKPFGSEGFDFAFAQGYFNFQPTSWFHIEAGNGNQFIGSGHRSLLLSDFTVNYPYFKPEFLLFNERLQYNIIYASHQNLYRLPFHVTPEANYEKKLSVSHYLEYSFNKNFQIGVFENNTWITTDSLGTKPFNYLAINPILGNSIFNGGNTPGRYNGFFGMNANYSFKQFLLYCQLIFDNKQIGGYQIGLRTYDIFTKNLNFQFEYNYVSSNTYTSNNKRANYNHSNLALAHPLGNNFQEILTVIDYHYKRLFINYSANYSLRHLTDSILEHTTLLSPMGNSATQKSINVWNNSVEIGYRFNKKYNLQVYIGLINRISSTFNAQYKSNFAYFGIKTNLHSKTLDW